MKIAELQLAGGPRLRDFSQDSVGDLHLKRLELRIEVARLWIERVKSPEFQNSEAEQVRWQLAQLQRDMLRLKMNIDKNM